MLVALFYLTAGLTLASSCFLLITAKFAKKIELKGIYLSLAVVSAILSFYQVTSGIYFSTQQLQVSVSILKLQTDATFLLMPSFYLFTALYSEQKFKLFGLIFTSLIAAWYIVFNHLSAYSIRFSENVELIEFSNIFQTNLYKLSGSVGESRDLITIIGISFCLWVCYRCYIAWRNSRKVFSMIVFGFVLAQVFGSYLGALTDKNLTNSVYVTGFIGTLLMLSLSLIVAYDSSRKRSLLKQSLVELQTTTAEKLKISSAHQKLSQIFMQAPVATMLVNTQGQIEEQSKIAEQFWNTSDYQQINIFKFLSQLGVKADVLTEVKHSKLLTYGPFKVSNSNSIDYVETSSSQWYEVKAFGLSSETPESQKLVVRIENITDKMYVENALNFIAAETLHSSPEQLARQMVQNLARIINAEYVYVAFKENDYLQTAALYTNNQFIENTQLNLNNTPSEAVFANRIVSFPKQLKQHFLANDDLQKLNVESYIGAPICINNQVIGVIAAMDSKPFHSIHYLNQVITIFANRLSSETKRYQAEEKIKKMAYEDYLTQLPNRAISHEYIQTSLQNDRKIALLLLDLDQFKTINDALGHDLGDEVIRSIGYRLRQSRPSNEFIARIGGDEFVVMFDVPPANQTMFIAKIAQELIALIHQEIEIGEHKLEMSATIGVVLLPENADTDLDAFRLAEIVLNKAKQSNRGHFTIYQKAMDDEVSEKLEITTGLRKALQNDEFKLFYQAQFDEEHQLVGAEALIRWIHPTNGLISPFKFIPIAEESGLINRIGDWVLKTGIKFLEQHPEFVGNLSLNVSAWQFARPDFVKHLTATLLLHQVPADKLTLEVTESALLTDVNETIKKLTEIRSFGIKIALDDFGTGYSSLAYLKNLPLDILKIDKTFIDELNHQERPPLLESMLSIGRHMQLKVVAEGVETELQVSRLIALNCPVYQGYYFAKPLPEHDFLALLDRHTEKVTNG